MLIYAFVVVLCTGILSGVLMFKVIEISTGIVNQISINHYRHLKIPFKVSIKIDYIDRIAFLVGAVLCMVLVWDTGLIHILIASIIGSLAGYLALKTWRWIKNLHNQEQHEKEVGFYLNTVELYIEASIPIRNALIQAREITPSLAPAVNKCLAYWSLGTDQALDILQQELRLDSKDMRIRLLKQIEHSGISQLGGIIRQETQRLEENRQSDIESRISLKPLFVMLYRFLPWLACMGMLLGTLLIRFFTIMKDIGLFT